MTGRILVFLHQADVALDALGHQLLEAGNTLVVVAVAEGEAIPELDGFDGLIVLGGEMHVWQEERHPWLVEEKAAIRAWVAGSPRPMLGICLGHQLLADALGGEVGRRHPAEVGVRPVRLTRAGGHDALLGPLGATFPALHWHEAEVRRVPDGAVVLATDDHGAVQAMRAGPAAWGVQFHPEIGPGRAGAWGLDPVFLDLLDAADGPGAGDRFGATLAAAGPGMTAVTAALAGALTDLL